MKISFAQINPKWLDKNATLLKVMSYVEQAAKEGSQLICFGETILPGYPFWVDFTDGARFDSQIQKEIYAYYLSQSVDIIKGDLDDLCTLAKSKNIAIYIGCAEKASDRGGHSVYCTLVYIDASGIIQSSHRKLMPTYEERLVWAIGDGHGLKVHKIGEFNVGGLNCWENWMPLVRSALYAQGENLHIAVWPGNVRNTNDLTRHIARESRSYVLSVSGLMRSSDIGKELPNSELMLKNAPEIMANGGSCLAAPDGNWVIAPIENKECLRSAEIDIQQVYKERHNFDPSGHYSRPDIIQISVNSERQNVLKRNK